MHSSINAHSTAGQGFPAVLPPIQSIINWPYNTISNDPTVASAPNEYGSYLSASNNGISHPFFVHPIDNFSNGGQEYSATDGSNHLPLSETHVQVGTGTAEQIKIKSQPRAKYHPRTAKENKKALHFIQSETDAPENYPSIWTFSEWYLGSTENIIEVSLMDISKQPHPYILENKEYRSGNRSSVCRENDNILNTLWFRLTPEDFNNGYKIFKIALIKGEQDEYLTKKVIRTRQLNKAKLRFTRIYQDTNGYYCRDVNSTVYSNEMTESNGDVSVNMVNPPYGPLTGNKLLTVIFKGLTGAMKDHIFFQVVDKTSGFNPKITKFSLNGNTIYFQMPDLSPSQKGHVVTSVLVYYEGEVIHESPYLYVAGLDQVLDSFNMNQSNEANVDFTAPENSNDSSEDEILSSTSSSAISKIPSKKRPRNS